MPGGQLEAARSRGMSYGQAMRNVIVPRRCEGVPAPLLNEFISLMKDTTLVGVIVLSEAPRSAAKSWPTFNSSALTSAR